MTGAYLRQLRNGKYENIEVEHLTPEERRAHLMQRDPAEIMRWMDLLCDQVVAAETLFNNLVEDGVLAAKTQD